MMRYQVVEVAMRCRFNHMHELPGECPNEAQLVVAIEGYTNAYLCPTHLPDHTEVLAVGGHSYTVRPLEEAREVSMEPVSRFSDGSPVYRFHTSLPTRGVRVLGEYTCDYPEEAQEVGRGWADRHNLFPSQMAEYIGVTRTGSGWAPVVNFYISQS